MSASKTNSEDGLNNSSVFSQQEDETSATRKENIINQFSNMTPSDSDMNVNKSDSDDAPFLTDSSDDIMNYKLSDCSPASERLEQTRETIMESLTQSFVSLAPRLESQGFNRHSDPQSEKLDTNDKVSTYEDDIMTVRKSMIPQRTINPLKRIPSDSAFPDFFRQSSEEYLESNVPSEEFVTVGSGSDIDEKTTMSFFSQSQSTYQLPLSKNRSRPRSKSASNCYRIQTLIPGNKRPQSAHSVVFRRGTNGKKLKENNGAPSIQSVEGHSDSISSMGFHDKKYIGKSPQPAPRCKSRGQSKSSIPTFKATKLPGFYHKKTRIKTSGSRSESCVLPKEDIPSTVPQGCVTARRSRSSSVKDTLMTRSTAEERSEKKDAGGVSYAFKHLPKASPGAEFSTVKTTVESAKTRPPTASRSPVRACSSLSAGHTDTENLQKLNEEKKYAYDSENDSIKRGDPSTCDTEQSAFNKVGKGRPSQRMRPGSGMKQFKVNPIKNTDEILPKHEVHKNVTSSGDPRQSASAGKILIKRPSMSQPNATIPVMAPAHLSETSNSPPPAMNDVNRDRGGNQTPTSPRDKQHGQPSVMSLKVDVSVRAEDGSVHNFRDISPPKNPRSSDLFAGVEDFIRSLLEGSGEISSRKSGQPLTTTPVADFSPEGNQYTGASPRSPKSDDGHRATSPGAKIPVKPLTKGYVPADINRRPWTNRLDAYVQRLQTEDNLLLTSTGSTSSFDTLLPINSNATGKALTLVQPKYTKANYGKGEAASCDILSGSRRGKHFQRTENNSQLNAHRESSTLTKAASAIAWSPVPATVTVNAATPLPRSVSHSPERRKSSHVSPCRNNSPIVSPRKIERRSRIPVMKRIESYDSVSFSQFRSHSPSPERRSFYHTARTTPERHRSVSPTSLCSLGDVTPNNSDTKSPRSADLDRFQTLSPIDLNMAMVTQCSMQVRSSSLSPRSARSNPHRSPVRNIDERSEAREQLNKPGVVSSMQVQPSTLRKQVHSEESGFYTEPISDREGFTSLMNMRTVSSSTDAKESSSDNDPCTSSSGFQSHKHSSVNSDEQLGKPKVYPTTAPTPAKRSSVISPPAPTKEDRAHTPIPRKRQHHDQFESPISITPCSQQDCDPMISSRTSFCSVNSPGRDRSPGPKKSSIQPEVRIIRDENAVISPPITNKISNAEPVSNESCIQSADVDEGNTNTDVTPSDMQRELIATENTVRLMEETITVLERQNQSLAVNTREVAVKLDNERAQRCDLKTARLMLHRVRKELEKSIKNSDQNRMELMNATDRIAEQDSAICLMKETLREECEKNEKLEKCLRRSITGPDNVTSATTSQQTTISQQPEAASDKPSSSLFAEHGSVRDMLAETEAELRTEKKAREEAERKLAEEISRKQRIMNAAKKWREQLSEPGISHRTLETKTTERDKKIVNASGISDSGSSNKISYRSIHTESNEYGSAAESPRKSKSNETITSQKFDIESATGSGYFCASKTNIREASCQCDEPLEDQTVFKEQLDEEKHKYELIASKLSTLSLERTDLKSQLEIVNEKFSKANEKKMYLEQELKTLITKIHEMQRDVQIFKCQSSEKLMLVATNSTQEHAEHIEMEKIKLKEYYQQQVEAIVQEKVTEFQSKVSHLEKIVRNQINTYTQSMQRKFREKLATASLQQKDIISRLEAEHSKELERLTAEYPGEIERLKQCLFDCRKEIVDKKSRLEQKETQVGTILRVVKLLIREGNAMKGDNNDTKDKNVTEMARKILLCMDLDLDDIASPRPRARERLLTDGSCVTFRSILDTPRVEAMQSRPQYLTTPPVPPRRKTTAHVNKPDDILLTKKESVESTMSEAFELYTPIKSNSVEQDHNVTPRTVTYTRFGDEVIRARSEETLRKTLATSAGNQMLTQSDVTVWTGSGSWTLDGQPPRAPPPTPPSATDSSRLEREAPAKECAQDVAKSVMKAISRPARVKLFADKAIGESNSSLSSFLQQAFRAGDAPEECKCKGLKNAMETYKTLSKAVQFMKNSTSAKSSSDTSIQRLRESASSNLGDETMPQKNCMQCNTKKKYGMMNFVVSGSSNESGQIFTKAARKALSKRATETGGRFSNPFSMTPLPSTTTAPDKITSKPPIQKGQSVSPSRSATAHSPSPVRSTTSRVNAAGEQVSHAEDSISRSRQDNSGKPPFVEKTIEPSKNILRKTSPSLQRMPSFDKLEKFAGSQDSDDDSTFALKHPLKVEPRDNRLSTQRKQLAAARKPVLRSHSISPRERKLFTLRNQQIQAEKKIIRTAVTKRTLSPTPVSPLAAMSKRIESEPSHETATTNTRDNTTRDNTTRDNTTRYTRGSTASFKEQYESRKRRKSSSSGMDWHKIIKPGQPWQDMYLHDYDKPNSNDQTFYTPEEHISDNEQSLWSPSYSWAPPRPGRRDKYNRYLSTGKVATEIALERFYATPERESKEARSRLKRSRKQAEVLEQINRLLAVSSDSDVERENGHRPADNESRRSRSRRFEQPTRDVPWVRRSNPSSPQPIVIEDVRRRALEALTGSGERHPMDHSSSLPGYQPQPDRSSNHQRAVTLSMDRDRQAPGHEFFGHKRVSSDVKNHVKLAKEFNKIPKVREAASRERSASHHQWTGDGRRGNPLVIVSRTPVHDLGALERPAVPHVPRSRPRTRHGSHIRNAEMDSWVNRWEQKWEHERKQRPPWSNT